MASGTRIFIDNTGKTYKANKPVSVEDIERVNPSQEQLDALPDNGKGISMYDWMENIRIGVVKK